MDIYQIKLELVLYLPTDAVAFSTAQFGGGAGPVYLDNVVCSGSERNLIDCLHNSFANCHPLNRGAGVRCQGGFAELFLLFTFICLIVHCYSQHNWQLYLWRCSSGGRLQSVRR